MSDSDVEEVQACPFCGLTLEVKFLSDHCEAHLAASSPQNGAPIKRMREATAAEPCSLCGSLLTPQDQESHALAHRLDQEGAHTTATALLREEDAAREQKDFAALQAKYGMSDKRPGTCYKCHQEGHWAKACPQTRHVKQAKERVVAPELDVIMAAQQPSERFDISPNVITLLKRCLEAQKGSTAISAALSGPTEHFQTGYGDLGWGCGYRNIQMLAGHLIAQRPECKAALFGGCGYVPDIPSLQAWLECAWKDGLDPPGAEQLGHSVQATHKWIGTTECQAVFRYFGVRACIADFKSGGSRAGRIGKSADGREIHYGVQCDVCDCRDIVGLRFKSNVLPDYDLCEQCRLRPEAAAQAPFTRVKPPGESSSGLLHAKLVDWVWNYFNPQASASSDCSGHIILGQSPVRISGKPPLYFQHEGHSRTIVGIERRGSAAGGKAEYNLLILDPSTRSAELSRALQSQQRWQQLVKRGVHTLKESEYQILYVADDIANLAEREAWKTAETHAHETHIS